MKRFFIFGTLLIFLSCASENQNLNKGREIEIWEGTSYITNDKQILNKTIKELYFSRDLETKSNYMTMLLTGEATYQLEENWKKFNKNLRLDRVHIIYDLDYQIKDGELIITSVKEDYVLKGENTDEVRHRLNNIIYSEREGSSMGLIPLIFNIWNKNVMDYIEFKGFKKGDRFKINQNEGSIELHSDTTSIHLNFIGEHLWVGY